MVESGSKWMGAEGNQFRVLNVVTLEDGHTWVYYIKNNADPESCREYSCYVESFLERFTEIVNS